MAAAFIAPTETPTITGNGLLQKCFAKGANLAPSPVKWSWRSLRNRWTAASARTLAELRKIKSGRQRDAASECPLLGYERTFPHVRAMSASPRKQTCALK